MDHRIVPAIGHVARIDVRDRRAEGDALGHMGQRVSPTPSSCAVDPGRAAAFDFPRGAAGVSSGGRARRRGRGQAAGSMIGSQGFSLGRGVRRTSGNRWPPARAAPGRDPAFCRGERRLRSSDRIGSSARCPRVQAGSRGSISPDPLYRRSTRDSPRPIPRSSDRDTGFPSQSATSRPPSSIT